MEAGVLDRSHELAASGEPIYVWGPERTPSICWQTSRLAECNIVAFLDSNPHYAGRELAGAR